MGSPILSGNAILVTKVVRSKLYIDCSSCVHGGVQQMQWQGTGPVPEEGAVVAQSPTPGARHSCHFSRQQRIEFGNRCFSYHEGVSRVLRVCYLRERSLRPAVPKRNAFTDTAGTDVSEGLQSPCCHSLPCLPLFWCRIRRPLDKWHGLEMYVIPVFRVGLRSGAISYMSRFDRLLRS